MTETPPFTENAHELLERYLAATRTRDDLLEALRYQPFDTAAFNEINAEIELVTLERDDVFRQIIASYDDHPIVRAGLVAIVLTEHAKDRMSYDRDIANALTVVITATLDAASDDTLADEIRFLAGIPGIDDLRPDHDTAAPSLRL
jgi:hypothetical protein